MPTKQRLGDDGSITLKSWVSGPGSSSVRQFTLVRDVVHESALATLCGHLEMEANLRSIFVVDSLRFYPHPEDE